MLHVNPGNLNENHLNDFPFSDGIEVLYCSLIIQFPGLETSHQRKDLCYYVTTWKARLIFQDNIRPQTNLHALTASA